MNYRKNTDILIQIDEIVSEKMYLKKGINKKNEIKRLIFEIIRREKYTLTEFLNIRYVKNYIKAKKYNYQILKNILVKLRYPETFKNKEVNEGSIYLPQLKFIPEKKVYQYSGIFNPEKIYIEKSVVDNKFVRDILNRYKNIEPVIIDRIKDINNRKKDFIQKLGKNELFLVEENYDIFKKCPCTKNVLPCGYYILNIGFGCVYDCSYCYLQHYINFPGIILPVNIDDILKKLSKILNSSKKILRIGTGEFTDSLVFDDLIPYSKYLIEFFRDHDHILELKTKSINIQNIIKEKPSDNIVISWSLNTSYCIEREEYYTPSLTDRLNAAKKVIKAGFKVGFHYDPIIYYKGWEEDYKKTVDLMYEYTKGSIKWISLGVLRFHRTLKQVIEMRYPETELLNGEILLDKVDNKMRYSEDIRIDIFKKMIKWIRKHDKDVIIYLCMEPLDVCKRVFLKSDGKIKNDLGIYYL